MDVEGADKNRSVRFNLDRQIFLACEFLDRFSVCAEDLHLLLGVALEIIIERMAADFASHARVYVLPPKNHNFPVKNPSLIGFRKFQFMTLRRFVGVVNLVAPPLPEILEGVVDDGFE